MSSITGVGTQAALESAREQQALNSEEFMQLLITELTNQDPLEPMSNQELINQISSIQELESNQNMSKDLTRMVNSFDGFIDQLDTLLVREQVSTASNLIGQLITGVDADGNDAFGQVRAISVNEDGVFLELDTGQSVNMDNVDQLGGNVDSVNASQMIGEIIYAEDKSGKPLIGTVRSLQVDGDTVELIVDPNDPAQGDDLAISLDKVSIIDDRTVEALVGFYAKGDGREGQVTGYSIDADGIHLILDNDPANKTITLQDITQLATEPFQQSNGG